MEGKIILVDKLKFKEIITQMTSKLLSTFQPNHFLYLYENCKLVGYVNSYPIQEERSEPRFVRGSR